MDVKLSLELRSYASLTPRLQVRAENDVIFVDTHSGYVIMMMTQIALE